MGAKNGKILGRPGQKIKTKIKNRRLWALRPPFEPIYSASGVKKHARFDFRYPRESKPCLKNDFKGFFPEPPNFFLYSY